jgi:Class III cytochrome C family
MMRDVKQSQRVGAVILAGTAVALLLGPTVFCREPAKEHKRADFILIDGLSEFGPLESQPVPFLHDLHTEAVEKEKGDCGVCHPLGPTGVLSQKFQRVEETDKETVMDIYHEYCLRCHKETAQRGMESGPVTCGECHVEKPRVCSSLQPVGYDLSLHYRHIQAVEGDCGICHHQYDPQSKGLEYVKGEEASCRDCHRDRLQENRQSFRFVAHEACIGCHTKMDVPIRRCGECHDLEKQKAILKLDEIPRLERGQPDSVLIRLSQEEGGESRMNAVPFDHLGHEAATSTCRQCHHETLKPCKDCHTLKGSDEGKQVKLERAMHAMDSPSSCVGCHEKQKIQSDCAGCHGLMEKGVLSEAACTRCHYGTPPGEGRAGQISLPTSAARPLPYSAPEIQESVTISVLSEAFDPVTFDHRGHVGMLSEVIGKSRLAAHFHGSADVVCQGCHHHTPVGEPPPRCESCHGRPFDEMNLFMPGLFGAYHRQCMECHRSMGIEGLSDCTSCHQRKGSLTSSVP